MTFPKREANFGDEKFKIGAILFFPIIPFIDSSGWAFALPACGSRPAAVVSLRHKTTDGPAFAAPQLKKESKNENTNHQNRRLLYSAALGRTRQPSPSPMET